VVTSRFQIQSLDACKRVGVSGHALELLGTWGLSTIIFGKSVSQERQAKERKFIWGSKSSSSFS
jgi:hypothetical protein